MKLVRPALAIALGGSVVAAGTAGAVTKPKPVCNLVKDVKGDGAGPLASDPGLDIISADIASDAKNITAVIRLAGPATESGSTAAPEGGAYYFLFNAPDATNVLYLTVSNGLTGEEYAMGAVEGSIYRNKPGVVTGHIDGNVITMTASRSEFSSLASVKPGSKLTNLVAEVKVPLEVPGVGGSLQPADDAAGSKSYTAGSLSCVKPGK